LTRPFSRRTLFGGYSTEADDIPSKLCNDFTMLIERSLSGFRASVPCKVNLFLEVLGKRPDGYHSLETVMMACSLLDDLEITHRDDGNLVLEVEFPNGHLGPLDDDDPAWRIPADQQNLILRTLDRLRLRFGLPLAGAHVVLTKRIPAMAGLGGGSADAAAALVLGMLLWQIPFELNEASSIASGIGSDINFFLEAQLESQNDAWVALCAGRGEQVFPVPILQPLHLVIVHPPRGCGTREVFMGLETSSHLPQLRSDSVLEAMKNGDARLIGKTLMNRLENAAAETTDWIAKSRKWLDRYNHHGQVLSGSGSARFCLCESAQQAETIAREIRLQSPMRAYNVETWYAPSIAEQIRRIQNTP
jgi:4-diphosphocytidyl-2-C-methyl-D-erythritol kinase